MRLYNWADKQLREGKKTTGIIALVLVPIVIMDLLLFPEEEKRA